MAMLIDKGIRAAKPILARAGGIGWAALRFYAGFVWLIIASVTLPELGEHVYNKLYAELYADGQLPLYSFGGRVWAFILASTAPVLFCMAGYIFARIAGLLPFGQGHKPTKRVPPARPWQ